MIEIEKTLNEKTAERIEKILNAADNVVSEIDSIISNGIENEKSAQRMIEILDKASSIINKLQPLNRQANGLSEDHKPNVVVNILDVSNMKTDYIGVVNKGIPHQAGTIPIGRGHSISSPTYTQEKP